MDHNTERDRLLDDLKKSGIRASIATPGPWTLIGTTATGTLHAHACGTVIQTIGNVPDVCPRCEANKRAKQNRK